MIAPPPALVITNARVTTDGPGPDPTAIRLSHGLIDDIGDHVDESDAVVVDAQGRRVVPGLIDSHLHLVRAGRTWSSECRWDGVSTLTEALDRLAAHCAVTPAGQWVRILGGWHPRQFSERRSPTKADLDTAAPAHPVFAQLLFEGAVLNTCAEQSVGGLHTDSRGWISGQAALRRLVSAVGDIADEPARASTAAFLRHLTALGITGASDMNGFGVTPEAYGPVFGLWRDGELPLRLRLHLGATGPGSELADFGAWNRFTHSDFGDDQLRTSGFGEIPSFGCTDIEGLGGVRRPSAEDRHVLSEVTRMAVRDGWPMHVHAILDQSIFTVLDVWEDIDRDVRLAGRRFALCHVEAIGAVNIARAHRLGVGISVQGRLVLRGADSAEAWGAEVSSNAPPLRDLLDAGLQVGAGSDGTVVASPNPWRTIWWLVSGEALDGSVARAERHRLTRREALAAHTLGSAWFTGEDHCRGRLQPGWWADLAVLSEDLFEVDDEAIPRITSVLTVVAGRIAHLDHRSLAPVPLTNSPTTPTRAPAHDGRTTT